MFGGCSLCFIWMLVQGGELLGYDQNPYGSLFCYFSVLSSVYIRQGCPVFYIEDKLPLVYCNHNKKLSVFPSRGCSLTQGEPRNSVCVLSHFSLFHLTAKLCVYDIAFCCFCCCCSCLFFITSITNWYQELKLRSREFKILV